MFKKILVPLDGSSLAEKALPVAEEEAKAHGASTCCCESSIPISSTSPLARLRKPSLRSTRSRQISTSPSWRREFGTRRRGIESKLAELVRFHGMRRARYRGLRKVNLQCLFTALVVNIKRWFNLIRARAPALSQA